MTTIDGSARTTRAGRSRHVRGVHKGTALAAVGAISLGAVGIWATTAGAATAPVPVFPDNIVVFPDRDFVSVEGYSGYPGATALVEVTRPGVGVVGSAEAIVSGTDVAFEINHPGGVCWGAGTPVDVTPDILPGDEVTLSIGGVALNTTTVLDAQASDSELLADGVTMLVRGHVADNVPEDQMEQRIIEPALTDTPIGKRDIRAVFGDFQPGPNGGYISKLEIDRSTDSFLATYVFEDTNVAQIAAAATGERAMAWQQVDADANRQGLTIAEFGEPGGPGMGGCPNGPLQSGPPAPDKLVAVPQSGGTAIRVDWELPTAIPGTPAIEGYRVRAVDQNPSGGGSEYTEIGRRIDDPSVSGITIDGLDPSREYIIEVTSISAVGETFPAATAIPATDATAPVITASPAGGSFPQAQEVTLTASEPGVDIYVAISTDGNPPADPIDGLGGTNGAPTPYTGPFTIDQSSIVKIGGYDPTGNPSVVQTLTFNITNDPTAGPTSITSALEGLEQVALTWAAADPVFPGATIVRYVANAYDQESGGSPKATATFEGDGTTGVFTGLEANTDYWFTIAAVNSVNSTPGVESARFGPVAPLGVLVAEAGPAQTNVPRNSAVQLDGTGSSTGDGITYEWSQISSVSGLEPVLPGTPLYVTISNPNQLLAGFTLPFYNSAMGNPATRLFFQLKVTDANGVSITDVVSIAPRTDTISIASARFKAGDFRVSGTGAINGATIVVRGVNPSNGVMTTYGQATVVAGAWELRLRNNAAPTVAPTQVFADSNQGATTSAPVTR